MAVSHIKTDTIGDFTGTVTIFNSQGSTQTVAATNLVRPSDWNSAHNQYFTLSGNTANASTVSGTNIVLSADGAMTLTGSGSVIRFNSPAQTVQTQNMVSINGSTGSIVFANSNNVSFGVNASTITATATFAQTVQPVAFSAGAASSNFSTLQFQDSNGFSFSNNAGSVRVTHDLQYTSNTSSITSNAFPSANTTKFAGTGTSVTGAASITLDSIGLKFNGTGLAGTSSGSAGANVGISMTHNTAGLNLSITAPAPVAQTNQTLSAIVSSNTVGNTSGMTFDARSVSFQGYGAASVGMSTTNTGSSILVSVPVQSVQTQSRFNLTLASNSTSGGAGYILISSGVMTLAGGNNVTLSQDGNAITISGANAGGAQTAISGIGVSNTTYSSGTVIFSAQANVTLNSSVNGASQYVQISANPAQTVQTQASGNIARTGFTTGATAGSVLVGTHDTAGLSLGVPAWITTYAQTNQSAIKALGVSNTGNTLGNTGVSTGIDWVFAGSGGITASQSTAGGGPNTIWMSVPINAGTGTSVTGLASITLDTAGIKFNGTGLAGTGTTFAGNNITGAMTINSAGVNLALTGNAAGAGLGGAVASDTTYTSGTIYFSNAGNITISRSVNGASQYIQFSGNPAQTNQTLSMAITGNTTSNTSGMTVDARSLTFQGLGIASVGLSTSAGGSSIIISVPSGGGAAVTVSDNATSGTIGRLAFTNLNGITLSLSTGAGSHTVVGSHNALTSQSNQAFSAAGGSSAFQTLSFSDNAYASWTNTGGQIALTELRGSLFALGAQTTQNSSTAMNLDVLSFSGGGAMTMGFSNGTIQVSAPATSSLVGASGLSISSNGSTISVYKAANSTYVPYYPASTSSQTFGTGFVSTGSAWVFPFSVEDPVIFNQVRFLSSMSVLTSATNATGGFSATQRWGVYSNNAQTLSLISSNSMSFAATLSSTNATFSYATATSTSGYGYNTTTATTTAQAQSLMGTVGLRMVDMQMGGQMTLQPGLYWLGVHNRSSTTQFSVGVQMHMVGNVMGVINSVAPLGVISGNITTDTYYHSGFGVMTSTNSANFSGTVLPSSIHLSGVANTINIMPLFTLMST